MGSPTSKEKKPEKYHNILYGTKYSVLLHGCVRKYCDIELFNRTQIKTKLLLN